MGVRHTGPYDVDLPNDGSPNVVLANVFLPTMSFRLPCQFPYYVCSPNQHRVIADLTNACFPLPNPEGHVSMT